MADEKDIYKGLEIAQIPAHMQDQKDIVKFLYDAWQEELAEWDESGWKSGALRDTPTREEEAYETELHKLQNDYAQYHRKTAASDAQIALLEKQNVILERQVDASDTQNAMLEKQLAALSANTVALHTHDVGLRSHATILQTQAVAFGNLTAILQHQIAALQDQTLAIQEQTAVLEKQTAARQDDTAHRVVMEEIEACLYGDEDDQESNFAFEDAGSPTFAATEGKEADDLKAEITALRKEFGGVEADVVLSEGGSSTDEDGFAMV